VHRWPLCDSGLVALAPRSRGPNRAKIIGEIMQRSVEVPAVRMEQVLAERGELEKRGVVLQHRTMMGLRDF
jgi:hypothetical protein